MYADHILEPSWEKVEELQRMHRAFRIASQILDSTPDKPPTTMTPEYKAIELYHSTGRIPREHQMDKIFVDPDRPLKPAESYQEIYRAQRIASHEPIKLPTVEVTVEPLTDIRSSTDEDRMMKAIEDGRELDKIPQPVRTCGKCGKDQANYLCGRCLEMRYCCRDCQHSHWKQHKLECEKK